MVDMSARERIEIMFNVLKAKAPENTTIIDLINKQDEHENISR